MGYVAAWKVLETIVADFRKRGERIPDKIMNDLRSAKTMIQISKAEKGQVETLQKIEEYLANVESYLASQGEAKFGAEQVDKWLERLEQARMQRGDEEDETRFVPGVPRDGKWVRVKPAAELSIVKLKALASECKLSYKTQNDGYLLVFGSDEQVKDFVKKMATRYGSKQESSV